MGSNSNTYQQRRPYDQSKWNSGNRDKPRDSDQEDSKEQSKAENVGLVNRGHTTKPVSGKNNHVKENCWQLLGKTPCEHCRK
jgi:hypothetical protein